MVILDILNRVDIAIHTDISLRKSLPFRAILIVKIEAIILIISPTMALIEDQVD